MGQIHRARPFLLLLGYRGQRFQHAEVLLPIVRALFIDPWLVSSRHELTAIKQYRLLVAIDAAVVSAFTTSVLAIGNPPLESFGIDAIGKLRIQLVIAIAINDEVLFERLVAVERFANVRDGGMKILFNRRGVIFSPEGVDDCVFWRAMVASRNDVTQDVARAPRGPRIG